MDDLRTTNEEGRTSCCNAYTSIGDYGEYCKACYHEVVPSSDWVTIELPEEDEASAQADRGWEDAEEARHRIEGWWEES